jgi:hypothetical protein
VKPFNWLFKDKKAEVVIGYDMEPERVYSEHHYLARVFKVLYIDIEGFDDDKLHDFMLRFSKDYMFLIKMPSWSFSYNDGEGGEDKIVDTMNYVNKVMKYADTIKGLVLEVGRATGSHRSAMYTLEHVFVKRTLAALTRVGVGLYLVNGITIPGVVGISMNDLFMIKKRNPHVSLLLHLHNSVLSGQKFMDVCVETGSVGGLSKNFEGVILSGTSPDKREVLPASDDDKFDYADYRKFLGQFPKKLIVYKGEYDDVVELDKKIKNG